MAKREPGNQVIQSRKIGMILHVCEDSGATLMIGKKHLRDVRAGLLEECAREGIDPARWFETQLDKLSRAASPDAKAIETLKLIRDGLQLKSAATKSKRKRATSGR